MTLQSIKQNLKDHKVVVIGCFDTKAEDFAFLIDALTRKGVTTITINTGVLGTTDLFSIDFEAETVAIKGGSNLLALRADGNRGEALKIMGLGAAHLVSELYSDKNLDGIIGMGGGGGTFLAISAMKVLPLGIPKLCLSTLATKDLSELVGNKDIVLMPSIVDVAGLNSISRVLISQAAGALCGMMDTSQSEKIKTKGSVAISVFGNTTKCVDHCTEILKSKGYDVLAFHAIGVGGRTMEELILEGCFDAVLDITTTELADELCGGICSAGPDRLNAAAKIGIPQVVVPGCLDMVNFGAMDSVPSHYKNRQLYGWAPDVTLMRTNKEENRRLGKILTDKINVSKGPVALIFPLGGLSKIGSKGEVFHDPEIDNELFQSVRKNVKNTIRIKEVEENINTTKFAEHVVKTMLELVEEKNK